MAVDMQTEQPQAEAEAEPVVETHTEAEPHFEPRGAYAFVLLMLLGYSLYFAFLYFTVFIERGG
jgi:hypothetical protein